jgi:hypothetical protein
LKRVGVRCGEEDAEFGVTVAAGNEVVPALGESW